MPWFAKACKRKGAPGLRNHGQLRIAIEAPAMLRHNGLMTHRITAYLVHCFTATGAALAMLALLAAMDQNWSVMALWLAVALVVDAVDGPLARHFEVKTNASTINGALLDLIIDFLTYVVIPALALYASGLLPGWTGWFAVLLIPYASALYFADIRMKTPDASFSGFPGCWNMLVLALLVIRPGEWSTLVLVVLLSVAMFLPLRFVHPIRTVRWRHVTFPIAFVWTSAIGWAAWTDFGPAPVLTVTVAITSLYLMLAGIAQQILPAR